MILVKLVLTRVPTILLKQWTRAKQQFGGHYSLQNLMIWAEQFVKHEINLADNMPFKEPHRLIPPAMYVEVEQHLQEMLNAGATCESSSESQFIECLAREKNCSFCLV